MFEEGDSVLVEYKLGRKKTWHEAVLKQKFANGWTVIWLTRDEWYGTTTTDVKETSMLDKNNILEKIETLLRKLAVERMKTLQEKIDRLHQRFSTLMSPTVLKISEMDARQARMELILDQIIENQLRLLEKHRELTQLDSGSWDALALSED